MENPTIKMQQSALRNRHKMAEKPAIKLRAVSCNKVTVLLAFESKATFLNKYCNF